MTHGSNRAMTVAVFLDRDGVINENRADYVVHRDQVCFVPGALRALALLAAAGLPCHVVTNQAAVGHGLLSEDDLAGIHDYIAAAVRRAGGAVAGFHACPHRREDGCGCRKPQPGLFTRAAAEHGLTLARSYYIGDALTDVRAGQAAGLTTILVRTGRGRAQVLHDEARHLHGYYVARDLHQAARWIVAREGAPWASRLPPPLAALLRHGVPSLERA
ncbi:MAG: D-glycero-beta-D-manno-heptose 1,7-bisphosphate 7-phosphatase [Chloroflexota bacterium]